MSQRLLLMFLICVCTFVNADIPDRIYWVEVERFSEQNQADTLVEQLSQEGYSPVCVYPSSQGASVRIGEFSVYMEAFLLFEEMKERFENATVRYNSTEEEKALGRTWSFTALQVPSSEPSCNLFRTKSKQLSARDLRFDNSKAVLGPGAFISKLTEQQAALVEAEAIDSTQSKGKKALLTAQARAAIDDFDGAREPALKVAQGDLESTPQERYDAMWLLGRVYHRNKWRRTSYRAYTEISSIDEVCEEDQAWAMLEKAGLILELSRSGSGRFKEVQYFVDQMNGRFAESTNPNVQDRLATANLMKLESYGFDKEKAKLVAQMEYMLENFSVERHERELATARLFGAECQRDLGKIDEAMENLLWVIERYQERDEIWPKRTAHLKRTYRVAYEIAKLYIKDDDLAWTLASELAERFPESSQADSAMYRETGNHINKSYFSSVEEAEEAGALLEEVKEILK